MKVLRDRNNFTEKIEVEATPEALRALVDECLAAAENRPNLKDEPPAEAWFDVVGDGWYVSIGMREEETNYASLVLGAPPEKPKGFLDILKRMVTARNLTASLTYDQVLEFLDVVLSGNVDAMITFLQPYAI